MFLADGFLNDQITISVTVEQIIAWIIVGLIAGLAANIVVRGRVSLGGLLFVGFIGAVVGGFHLLRSAEHRADRDLRGGILIRWIDINVSNQSGDHRDGD